jgi:hypothetical protein
MQASKIEEVAAYLTGTAFVPDRTLEPPSVMNAETRDNSGQSFSASS